VDWRATRGLRGHNRRETNQPKPQTRAKTIAGLTKMQAAMISHCFQIGTVPIGLSVLSACLSEFALATVDGPLTGTSISALRIVTESWPAAAPGCRQGLRRPIGLDDRNHFPGVLRLRPNRISPVVSKKSGSSKG